MELLQFYYSGNLSHQGHTSARTAIVLLPCGFICPIEGHLEIETQEPLEQFAGTHETAPAQDRQPLRQARDEFPCIPQVTMRLRSSHEPRWPAAE